MKLEYALEKDRRFSLDAAGRARCAPLPCDNIQEVAAACSLFATDQRRPVFLKFNDVALMVKPNDLPQAIVERYSAESKRRYEEYVKSPEYKHAQARDESEANRKRAALDGALAASPTEPTWADSDGWARTLAANMDGYGGAVMAFAHLWARIMEGRIAAGGTVEDSAEAAARIADVDGITGFMYGCAVSILAKRWKHGEALRRWHNTKTQLRDEGDKANESGSVLNPASLNIG